MYSEIESNKRKTWIMMIFFVVVISILAWFVSYYLLGSPYFTIAILAGAVAYATFSYFNAAKLATTISKAQEVTQTEQPRLYTTVENLAITEGLPTPKIYIIDDPAPNAFASGKDPNHSIIVVTRGLLDIMDDAELQGVIAHEMAHIKNYDIRVMMVAMALVLVVAIIADISLRVSFFGGGRRRSSSSGQAGGIVMIVGIIGLILAPIAAKLIQAAISRKREYLADASGALATRYPEGLASALTKLQTHGTKMKSQNSAMAHMYIANPLKKTSYTKFFSTHPPLEDRIAKLKEMENTA